MANNNTSTKENMDNSADVAPELQEKVTMTDVEAGLPSKELEEETKVTGGNDAVSKDDEDKAKPQDGKQDDDLDMVAIAVAKEEQTIISRLMLMLLSISAIEWLGQVFASEISLGGDVKQKIYETSCTELVPKGYLTRGDFPWPDSSIDSLNSRNRKEQKGMTESNGKDLSISCSSFKLRKLRHLVQKYQLGQDIFVVGSPGSPSPRWLALSFCELLNKEYEYLQISRDTTESDLKQRRELTGVSSTNTNVGNGEESEQSASSSFYVDQAPTRAALHGRILIIEGMEKAERNVLPTLNNLLENREMALDDGRYLLPQKRYDELKLKGNPKFVPVHPDFRVIALGTPCPPYRGFPLDPPIRSRFQALYDNGLPAMTMLKQLTKHVKSSEIWNDTIMDDSKFLSLVEKVVLLIEALRITEMKGLDSGRYTSTTSTSSGSSPGSSSASMLTQTHFPEESAIFILQAFLLEERLLLSKLLEEQEDDQAGAWATTELERETSSGWLNRLLKVVGRVFPLASPPEWKGALPFTDETRSRQRDDLQMLTKNLLLSNDSSDDSDDRTVDNYYFQNTSTVSHDHRLRSLPSLIETCSTQAHHQLSLSRAQQEVLKSCLIDLSWLNRDIILMSYQGSGKSSVARLLADIHLQITTTDPNHTDDSKTDALSSSLPVSSSSVVFPLFKDMTTRDLIQRRVTSDATGATGWADSPLITAAKTGQVCILDGAQHLGGDALASLKRLMQDREIDLLDGTRLQLSNGTVHPNFRIIILGSPSGLSSGGGSNRSGVTGGIASGAGRGATSNWLTDELYGSTSVHYLPCLERNEALDLLLKTGDEHVSKEVEKLLSKLIDLAYHDEINSLQEDQDGKSKGKGQQGNAVSPSSFAPLLSIRQLLRIGRKMRAFPSQANFHLQQGLRSCLMLDFIPTAQQDEMGSLFAQHGIDFPNHVAGNNKYNQVVEGDSDKVERKYEEISNSHELVTTLLKNESGTISERSRVRKPELVPNPLFFDTPAHREVLHRLLEDLTVGERHLLLIGNQGVGKNKLADRLLHLLQREREYVQLHRDSTVSVLTLSPTLENGRIVWEDSPLVRAIRNGHVLMVDEADKAPVEVISVLKSLIEDGEMLLADGRRIIDPRVVGSDFEVKEKESENVVYVHPEFQMWILANRPGYPFLGNNFFSTIGDVFSAHMIGAPDLQSEISMLQSYAPSVDTVIIQRIASAFAALRDLCEEGTLKYPYSTREAVHVVKDLEMFPQDGVVNALETIFGFDALDSSTRKRVSEVMQGEGIPLGEDPTSIWGLDDESLEGNGEKILVSLAKTFELGRPEVKQILKEK
eukprot:g2850.t1